MVKYYDQDYKSKSRIVSPIDRVALAKQFQDEDPERNALLQECVDRINLLLNRSHNTETKEAHDMNYTDDNGNRVNIGDTLDTLKHTRRWRLMLGA